VGMKYVLSVIMIGVSFCYFLIFSLVLYGEGNVSLFEGGFFGIWGFILALFLLICSSIALGRYFAEENVQVCRRMMLRELRAKEKRLTDYIVLARLVTSDDTEQIIKDTMLKLQKKWKLEDEKND